MPWGWLDVGTAPNTSLYLFYAGRNCQAVDQSIPCCILDQNGTIVQTSVPAGCTAYRIYVPNTFWEQHKPTVRRFELQVGPQMYSVLPSPVGTYVDSNHNIQSNGMLRTVNSDGVITGRYAADEANLLPAANCTWAAQMTPTPGEPCTYNVEFDKKGHSKALHPVRLHLAANACALLWLEDGNIWRKLPPRYARHGLFRDRVLVWRVRNVNTQQ